METTAHPDQGLKLCEVFIEEGVIKMGLRDKIVAIGDLDTLLSLPPYKGGDYETANGLEIDLEEFISEMGIPPFDAKDIKYATPSAESEGEISERMGAFNGYLHSQLEGNIARKDEDGEVVVEGE